MSATAVLPLPPTLLMRMETGPSAASIAFETCSIPAGSGQRAHDRGTDALRPAGDDGHLAAQLAANARHQCHTSRATPTNRSSFRFSSSIVSGKPTIEL